MPNASPLLRGAIRALFLSMLALASVSPSFAEPTSVPARDPRIAIMGRVAYQDGAAEMGFPGVTIRFRYRGETPKLVMTATTENCFFDLTCNGWDPVTFQLKAGDNTFLPPIGVAPDQGWEVEIARRTESWMGEATLVSLELPEGSALLPPSDWPKRKLMFIGDSTTCGEFNERSAPNEETTPRFTNVLRSYGPILARHFDAQFHLVAYGGQGIIRDWSGKAEGPHVALATDYFERSMPRDDSRYWDHSKYVPDLILINLGTDFDAGPLDEDEYIDVYHGFVIQVRAAYPLSYILLCESNFLSDQVGTESNAHRAQLWRTLQAVVERSIAAGDARIGLTPSRYFSGTAKDTHLTVFQHEQLAAELIAPISAATGWK